MRIIDDKLFINIDNLKESISINAINKGLDNNRNGRSSWAHRKGLDGNKRSVWIDFDTIPERSKSKLPSKEELLQRVELPIGIEVQGDKIIRSDVKDLAPTQYEELSTKQLEVAMAKYNIIKECNRFIADKPKRGIAIDEFVYLLHNGGGLKNEYEILSGKISDKSIYRWMKLLEDNNYNIDALAPSKQRKSKSASLKRQHEEILVRMYVHPNAPKLSQSIRWAVSLMEQQGLDVPSDAKMRRFLNDYVKRNGVTVTAIRKGVKAAKDGWLPYIEKDPMSINFMDAWVADGHKLNFTIQHPDDPNKLVRPTLIAWVDMRTLMVMGFEIMITENTTNVLSAFRNALIGAANVCGVDGALVPKTLYMDNGRAFKNKFFNQKADLEHDLDGLFVRMRAYGLEHVVYAQPYNARTKIIERMFRDWDEMEKLSPTYVGNSIADKPAYMMRNEKFARKLHEIMVGEHGAPTLYETYDMISAWVNIYNNRIGNGKWLNGSTPANIAISHIQQLGWDNYSSRHITEQTTDYMLQRTVVKRLQRNGIKINGIWYLHPDMYQLSKHEDWNFIVRFDPMRPDKIHVYNSDGTFFCTAKQYAGQNVHAMAVLGSDADRQKLAAANKVIKDAEKELHSSMNAVMGISDKKRKKQPQKSVKTAEKELHHNEEEFDFKLYNN
ncbi:MAG: Mu transposase C-terminal domain-containing protein [Bacteroidales bacterium]|jgi:putative transposase|nr:Mu transposase C-terminal domain-containing protein [Bacteroidales bacterium]